MNILICYASTEGQTRKIALQAAETVMKLGHKVSVENAVIAEELDIEHFDAAILAGSVHIGRYQTALVHRIAEWLEGLKSMPSAFISVTLSAAGDENDLEDAKRCAAKLADETGWTADMVHHAAGALRFTQYDFFKRWAMRFIAMQKGEKADTSKDVEYTDWVALESFLAAFVNYAAEKKVT